MAKNTPDGEKTVSAFFELGPQIPLVGPKRFIQPEKIDSVV
jgi:hypothetical protein